MKQITGALWLLGIIVVFWLASQDVGLAAQALFAAATIVAVFLLLYTNGGGLFRIFVLGMAGFVAVRYFAWRTEYSLPPMDSAGFWPGLLIYLAEAHGFVLYFLSFFVASHPRDRAEIPLDGNQSRYPTVDVFIPTYNEPTDLVRTTIIAASQLRYPTTKLRVHVLDDGGTDAKLADADRVAARAARARAETLQAICAELGVNYLTRTDNRMAKAGNINAALTRTNGDLILVLDADHVPTEDILERTVGQFMADPDMALIQTPHFFATPDPVERNLDTFSTMPSENEMFYGKVQKGLDFWNASFFCGSAAILRRSSLLKVGGVAGSSVTEDAETSLELHSQGFRSGYIERTMVAGLSPATLGSFIGQRTRWAQGMIQILMMKFPLFKQGLSLPQRLCYLNSSFFWLFPLSRITFLIAPLFFIFFQMRIFEASLQEFVAFIVPHFIIILLITKHLYGKLRWPFFSDLYETLLSLHLIPALVGTFLRPKKPVFKVTPKDESVDRDFVSSAIVPLAILAAVLVVAQIVGIWRWYEIPASRDHLLIVLIWNSLSLILVLGALGVGLERRVSADHAWIKRRQDLTVVRNDVQFEGILTAATLRSANVRVVGGGDPATMAAGAPLSLSLHRTDTDETFNVDAVIDSMTPVQGGFDLDLTLSSANLDNERNIVRMVYGDSAVWETFLQSRRRSPLILVGLGRILLLGLQRLFVMTGLLFTGDRAVDRPDWRTPSPQLAQGK